MSASPDSRAAAPRRTRPSGTVTFVFTDIEGSTARWDRDRSAMTSAVRLHDAIVREHVATHQGHVFKTVGDAFCIAFSRPEDAVRAAIAVQRALQAADFRAVGGLPVRMSIHTGTADERDDDYFGPTLNRVARLLSVAHGGQVLLSGIAAELVRGTLDADVALCDLGEHRLKDISASERVFQLVAPGLPAEFPPLRSIERELSNLPTERTSFINRTAELAALTELIRERRVVTLVGSGGVGKTRSAIRLGNIFSGTFADGVWFIDLAALRDSALVINEVASAFDIRETPSGALIGDVVARLAPRAMLLIIDNCEHVIDQAAFVVNALLRGCPNLKILATSREALRIDGEYVFPLAPFPVPEKDSVVTVATAGSVSSIALFLERAKAVNPTMTVDDANVAVIGDICRRLDGIPFAIELAAAKLQLLRPAKIRELLRERFRLLKTTRRDISPRQQTLRALIDWSYNLLTPAEQTLLRRLAVFAGAFGLEAAGAVGTDAGVDDFETLELLTSLVAKSLVVADQVSVRETRYRLLESTREFAVERLRESGEYQTVAANHADYVLRFVRAASADLSNSDEPQWLDTVAAELGNIRTALDWLFGAGNAPNDGAEIAASLGFFWHSRRFEEGANWLGAARARRADLDAKTAANVLIETVRTQPYNEETLEFAIAAVDAARRADDPAVLARALEYLGQTLINAHRFEEARAALEESIAIARGSGGLVSPGRPMALLGGALLAIGQQTNGDYTPAIAMLYEALTVTRKAKRHRDSAVALQILSEAALLEGRPGDAVPLAREALDLAERLGDVRAIGMERCQLAHALLECGDATGARAHAVEAARILRDAHVPNLFTIAFTVLCAVFARTGELQRAARLHGFVEHRFATSAFPPGPYFVRLFLTASHELQQRLDGDALFAERGGRDVR